MEEKMIAIIKKVKCLYKHNKEVNDILQNGFVYIEHGFERNRLKFHSIRFSYYSDYVLITDKGIYLSQNNRERVALLEYKNLEKLMAL